MTGTAQATTYYVDKLLPGNDSNNGTSESTPFLTIQKCLLRLAAGDTCLVKNGTYTEYLLFQGTMTGTAAQPITLKNYPRHTPVIDCSSAGKTNCVNLNESQIAAHLISYFVLEGFEIRNAYASGIKFSNVDHLVIRNNYIHNNGNGPGVGNGILSGSGTYVTIERNRIRQNGQQTSNQGHGLYVTGSHYNIVNNILDGNGGSNMQLASYPKTSAQVPDVSTYQGFHDSIVANNTLAYSSMNPAIILWNAGVAPSNNTIVNNLFFQNAQNSTAANGISFSGTNTNTTVRNNVGYATAPGATNFFINKSNCSSGCTINTNYGDDLPTASPSMLNAPDSMPSSPDYNLTSNSTIAIDRGLNLGSNGIITDFVSRSRPAGNGYDIGAYEFSTTTALAPPRNLTVR
jgi:hypothetical protein